VAPEDEVRVPMGGVFPKVVRATEFACFQHLAPTFARIEVQLEESVVREVKAAAHMTRRSRRCRRR
jgi:hypothetical protein